MTEQKRPVLSRMECNALRGIAIIGIVLHNYCHWLGFAVKENEYTFKQQNLDNLLAVVASPDINLPIHLLSFFGHYGVPVFLFLSAYGLVMKYEGTDGVAKAMPPVWQFVKKHFLKLFSMMIIGFVSFTMLDAITPGRHHYGVVDVLAQLFMVNNLLPNPDRVIWPGPYWFFGVMLQLYIVYRLFLYRASNTWLYIIVVLCWLLQYICPPESGILNYIRYNFVGAMLPFCFGLHFARSAKDAGRTGYTILFVVSLGLVVWFGMDYLFWFIVPFAVCSVCISLVKVLPQRVNEWLSWVGSISAALFVMHPLTRKIFIPISRQGEIYVGLLLYIIASVAVACLVRELMKRVKIG